MRKRELWLAVAMLGLSVAAVQGQMGGQVSSGPPMGAPQRPAGPIRVSGGVMAGQIVSQMPPVYPSDARANHIQGTVVMVATIGTDGTVSDLKVVSGPQVLQDAALEAVQHWVYKPYLLNGEPVEVQTTITVNFQLQAE